MLCLAGVSVSNQRLNARVVSCRCFCFQAKAERTYCVLQVFLLSLQHGAAGLTLVRANHVFMIGMCVFVCLCVCVCVRVCVCVCVCLCVCVCVCVCKPTTCS